MADVVTTGKWIGEALVYDADVGTFGRIIYFQSPFRAGQKDMIKEI